MSSLFFILFNSLVHELTEISEAFKKSTFAIILVNHLLLVANLMMIVFSCKKELKEHLTIPKENKSKIFFSFFEMALFLQMPIYQQKKNLQIWNHFFFVFIYHIYFQMESFGVDHQRS